eukprot:2680469-Pyramimonas_sp.AAC.1
MDISDGHEIWVEYSLLRSTTNAGAGHGTTGGLRYSMAPLTGQDHRHPPQGPRPSYGRDTLCYRYVSVRLRPSGSGQSL